MNEPTLTLIGNLTEDPTLRYTPNGAAVVNLTIAQTPKIKQGDQWVDGETIFARCSAWREMAEHISESLTRGTRVVANVRMKSRTYETKEGQKRTVTEYEIDEIGPSLRYATAKVTKAQRAGGGQPQQQGGWNQQTGRGGFGGDPNADPWATQGQQTTEETF